MAADPRIKTVLLTEIISPYRIPVFNEIAAYPTIDLKVVFFAETERERSWRVPVEKIRFPYEVLPGVAIPLPDRFPVFFNPGLTAALKREAPGVLICGGYHHPSSLAALWYANAARIPFILWCESHLQSARLRGPLFDWYRRRFVRRSQGFIVPGTKSREYLLSLAADDARIWTAPNAVDNPAFSREVNPAAEQARWRGRFSKNVILYVGRLVESKGLRALLQAVEQLSKSTEVQLILVGEGVARSRYESFCASRGLSNVFFEGFKQQEDLSFYYSMADIFVLPSLREEWGLVLNEAAAAGLPLIGSEAAGASRDLIEEGENGFRVPPGDARVLAERLSVILGDPTLKEKMGQRSRQIAQRFSPAECAAGFLRALQGVKGAGP